MPYVIVYEDGQSVELRGSFDSQQGNVLFAKLGLSDRTKTTGKKKDLPDIKCEYFTILERSGFQLVSSNACHDATLTGKNKVVREYIFHKYDESTTYSASPSPASLTRKVISRSPDLVTPDQEQLGAAASVRSMSDNED